MLIFFLLAIFSGSCKISSASSLLGLKSKEMDISDTGSGPKEILGLIRDKNSRAFSIHSSHLEEVCFNTAEAKASKNSLSLLNENISRYTTFKLSDRKSTRLNSSHQI